MAVAFLWRWLGLAPKQRPDLRIIVFTRASCPLCEEAWELLQRQQRRYGFALEAKDIDESAELAREYGEWVPVVTINGQVRFRGHVNEVLLRRILDHPA
jgi:glutaredoxin